MSEIAEPIAARGSEEALLDRLVAVRLQVNWQVAAYAALIIVAAGMRFWDLGSRAIHHDESLHAWTAWKLFDGQGYEHQAWMHGPFQFFGTALSFFLFGVSDYTARILPAFLGSAVILLPFFLRKRLGTVGALLAAAGIAFSPTLLYFSRFARNDIYITLFTLALVVCLWRYIDERKPRYLYVAALVLGISFATNESTFINAAVLVVFLNAWTAVHFWRQLRERNRLDSAASAAVLTLLLPLAWAVVALWPFTSRWRESVGLTERHPAADFLIVIGTLTLPQFAAAVQVPLKPLLGADDATLARSSLFGNSRENVLGFFTIVGLIAAAAVIGLRWNARMWGIAALAFYVPYALLYTSLFTNMDGFYSGHWGALDYWLSQQDVARGQQPWFYYLMLIPAYEFLPLVFAAPALFYWTLRGDVFRRFLVFWFAATVFGYSVAGEKMPWISVYPTLPLVLIAAVFLGDVLTSGLPRRAVSRLQPYLEPLAAAALGLVAVAVALFGPDGGGGVALRVLAILAASAAVIWLLLPVSSGPAPAATKGRGRASSHPLVRPSSHRRTAALGCATLAGGLLAATLFVGIRLTYQLGDVPRELLVYTQTSPYVPDVVESIEAAGRNSGLNDDLPVVVDGGIEPWEWYLRNYTHLTYANAGSNFQPPEGAVVLLLASNEQAMQPYAADYDQPVRFPLRWWYPEFDTYKTAPTAGVIRGVHPTVVPRLLDWFIASLFRPGTWETWWDYFRYRDPPGTAGAPEERLGRLDMLAYFPKEYAVPPIDVTPGPGTPTASPTETVPPPELPPEQTLPVTLTIGQGGSGDGEFNQPGGLALDSAGNLYVADVINHRIQKFDPTGKFLAQAGGKGAANGQFNEPWGLAVDGEGNVYVADTFNHRIQKFDSNLKFLLSWGRPATSLDNPEQDAFWGPRDVAIDAAGDVWITDGGTGRVLKYSAGGRFIAAFGGAGNGPGQLVEPTSIEIAASGDIFVADHGNRRVQRFDAAFKFVAEYAVPGWLRVDSLVKPYLALLPDGGFVVSDPTQNKLFRFDAEGKPVATFDAEGAALALPRGLVFDGKQGLYVAEALTNQVRLLTLSAAP